MALHVYANQYEITIKDYRGSTVAEIDYRMNEGTRILMKKKGRAWHLHAPGLDLYQVMTFTWTDSEAWAPDVWWEGEE